MSDEISNSDWRDDYHDEPISDADMFGAGLLVGIAVARGELPESARAESAFSPGNAVKR